MGLYSSPQGDCGIWFALHTLAMHADEQDLASKATYASQMKYLALRLQCKECSTHFQAFLRENPLSAYFRKEGGIFMWSCHFHNSVNFRLGKPVISLDAARALYNPEGAHSCIDCGHGSNSSPEQAPTPKAKDTHRSPGHRSNPRFTRVSNRRR